MTPAQKAAVLAWQELSTPARGRALRVLYGHAEHEGPTSGVPFDSAIALLDAFAVPAAEAAPFPDWEAVRRRAETAAKAAPAALVEATCGTCGGSGSAWRGAVVMGARAYEPCPACAGGVR